MNVAIDVGASKIKIAVFKDLDIIGLEYENNLETTNNFSNDIKRIAEAIATKSKIKNIFIAMPGYSFSESIGVIESVNLPDWNRKNISNELKKHLNFDRLHVLHDGVAHALSEINEVEDDYVFIAWGSGIGAAYIRKGVEKISYQQIEFGHQIVNGKKLEELAGGKFIQQRFGQEAQELEEENWQIIIEEMSVGLSNLITLNYPPEIIWGGGVSLNNKNKINEIVDKARQLVPFWEVRETKFANHNNKSAIIGIINYIKYVDPKVFH